MDYLMKKGKALMDAVDGVLYNKDLRSNLNPEVRRFIEEYHALTFELATYRNTPPTMTIEPGLAELIVARIDAMNEMLLAYQSDCDRATFNDAMVMRAAYRLDELNEVRREIQTKIDAAAQAALTAAAYGTQSAAYEMHSYQVPNVFAHNAANSSMPMYAPTINDYHTVALDLSEQGGGYGQQ